MSNNTKEFNIAATEYLKALVKIKLEEENHFTLTAGPSENTTQKEG